MEESRQNIHDGHAAMGKLPISAMVVGCNEEKVLEGCLQSLGFCDEILYTDLSSKDRSVAIAEKYQARIFHSPRVPGGEYAQAKMVPELKNDWFIFIDPDERISKSLQKKLVSIFAELADSDSIGALRVPWLFHLKNYRLKGTVWGNNRKYLLVHKDRFVIAPVTHYGRKLKAEYKCREMYLNKSGSNFLHHLWMPSFKVFFEKHFRYLKHEGRDRFNEGQRIKAGVVLQMPFREFHQCFIKARGYKDGMTGLLLSCFWAYYQTHASVSHYLYQRKHS